MAADSITHSTQYDKPGGMTPEEEANFQAEPDEKRGRVKTPRDVQAKIIQNIIHWIGRCAYKHEIKLLLRKQYHKYIRNGRTCEKYIAAARRIMAQRDGESLQDKRSRSVNFWGDLIRDANTDLATKILARDRLDRIEGTHSAYKIADVSPTENIREMEELRQSILRNPDAIEMAAMMIESAVLGVRPPIIDAEEEAATMPLPTQRNGANGKNGH